MIESRVKQRDRPALIAKEHLFTFSELNRLIRKMSKDIRTSGVKCGDKIALLGKTCVEYPIVLMSLFQMGVITVPMSTRSPPRLIIRLLQKIKCDTLYRVKKNKEDEHFPHLFKKYVKELFLTEDILRDAHETCCTMQEHLSVLPDFSDEIMAREATIIFTSGSTAEPKAVVHTLRNHYFSAHGSNANIRFQCGDRWLLSLPLYHVGGLAIVIRAFLGGGTIVIPDENVSLAENIQEFEVSHISLVATQLHRLLQNNKAVALLKKLKAILIGGSAISPALIQQAIQYDLPIYITYGSTEMASQITTTQPGDGMTQLLTSGKLLEHRQLKIMRDGEILVKGKTLCKGYVEGDIITPVFDDEGWFHTGDLGRLDKKGYLTVLGRKDNLFISGGENIQPEEIEKHLCHIKGILQAVVVPVEHEEFGARPVAFLKTNKDRVINPEYIRKNLEKNLPRFKVPDYFFPFPSSLPRQKYKLDRSYFQRLAKEKKLGSISFPEQHL